jgi:hypothetical protein
VFVVGLSLRDAEAVLCVAMKNESMVLNCEVREDALVFALLHYASIFWGMDDASKRLRTAVSEPVFPHNTPQQTFVSQPVST